MEITYKSSSPEETCFIAEGIGKQLAGGEVFLFRGNLGAGKTLFIKGLLRGLGFDENEVTSPSFALVNRYHSKFEVFHIDLWRIAGGSVSAFAIGLEEILEDEKAIVIIEWSEKLGDYEFGRPVVVVEMKENGASKRIIKITSTDSQKVVESV